MKKIVILIVILTSSAFAYMNITLDEPMEGLRSNSIIEIVYDSSGIWLGTAGGASYLPDGDSIWQTYTAENGLHSTEVSALAFSRVNDITRVCIATLHTEYASGQNVPFGDGYSITTDGGDTWLDESYTKPFYANYFGMLSYDLDMYEDDIYSANFYGGLLRSIDGGVSWENLFLNSDDSTDLADSSYRSYSNRYFSTKVDYSLAPDTISVWGGSAAGLNRFIFTNYNSGEKQDSAGAIAHREADMEGSLPGDHVVALAINGRPGRIYDAFAVGGYAYVAHDYEGLIVVDISTPSSPQEVDSLDTDGRAWAVFVEGDYVYIADYGQGLLIADISDPANPNSLWQDQTSGRAVNVFVEGNYAYVADDLFGLFVYDISGLPAPPSLHDSYTLSGGVNDVHVAGDYAYLANGDNGLVILSIADIADSIYLVSQFENDTLGMFATEIVVDSIYAYIADGVSGVLAVDVSDPANPQFKDSFSTPGDPQSIYFANDYIFMTDGMDVRAFELTAPDQGDSLIFVGGYGTPGTALNVMVAGDYAYVADNYFGLQIVDVSAPGSMALAGNFAPVCSTYLWAACRPGVGEANQQYGIAYSPNYGKTWTTVIDEPGWDFAFIGDTVIVATDNGLYISDNYTSWDIITEMEQTDQFGNVERRYFPSGIYAVETVGSDIWAGGADGTVYTSDGCASWQIYRSELRPDEHFAYPSPFSPVASTRRGTTIHYMPPQTTDVTIKIFDFNLDLVATVADGETRLGGVEADNDVWDGKNDKGEMVANGVYFYQIKLGTGEDWWGKAVVVK
jgi:hypothetical protein